MTLIPLTTLSSQNSVSSIFLIGPLQEKILAMSRNLLLLRPWLVQASVCLQELVVGYHSLRDAQRRGLSSQDLESLCKDASHKSAKSHSNRNGTRTSN